MLLLYLELGEAIDKVNALIWHFDVRTMKWVFPFLTMRSHSNTDAL